MVRKLIMMMVLLALCLVWACEREQQPIKIGLSINLSGRGGTAGEQIRNGALLAVEEINAKGGIKGRPLQLLVRDDENNDAGIEKADKDLIAQGVVAIIGHSYSANTLKAYPLVTGSDTLLITGYTATTKLSGKDDLFLRTSVDCQLYGQKTAELLNKKGASTITFLMDMSNPAFVLDYVQEVERHYQGGMTRVQFESRENVDWPRITQELMAGQPDAIVLLTEASMTAVAVQYLRENNFAGPMIGTVWTQSPTLFRIGGPATEGMSIVTFVDPDNSRDDYLLFAEAMQKNFDMPATARASRAYEMIAILADSLRRADKVEAQALKRALLSGDFESILGKLRFDSYGDVIRPVYEVIVKDGRFTNGGEI